MGRTLHRFERVGHRFKESFSAFKGYKGTACIREKPIDLLQLDKEIENYRNSHRYIQYVVISKNPFPTRNPAQTIVPKKKCGVRGMGADHILQGKQVPTGSEPWMVLLHFELLGRWAMCGGTLIASTWILTAAHCKRDVISKILVGLDMYEFNLAVYGRKSIKVEPENFFLYPSYDHNEYDRFKDNDLGLIKLPYPVTDFPHIYPICLPKTDKAFTSSRSHIRDGMYPAYVVGWGYTRNDPPAYIARDLAKTPLKLQMNYWRCLGFLDVLCANSISPGAGVCYGDSGGPLIVSQDDEFTIVGITSQSHKSCVQYDFEGTFTSVFKHLPWINEMMVKHGD